MKNLYQPYTYLIGWSKHNLWYYGAEYSKQRNANPENLWTKYFTSSKYVKEARKILGEPDVIQVRRVFETAEKALLWEAKILKRLNVIVKPEWLNKNIAGHFRTFETYPNPIAGSTYIELYGDRGRAWKKNIGTGLKKFWDSEEGAKAKKSLSKRSIGNKLSLGRAPVNKITDEHTYMCIICGTERTIRKVKNWETKRTCGSKSCVTKLNYIEMPERMPNRGGWNKKTDTFVHVCIVCNREEIRTDRAKNKSLTCGKSCAATYSNLKRGCAK